MKIILHIGMPKCGSSALQSYFCSPQFFKAAEEQRIGYVVLLEDGSLLEGQNLLDRVSLSNYAYITSCNAKSFSNYSPKINSAIKKQIFSLSAKFDTLILSNEGWGPNPDHFPDNFFLNDRQFEVSALAYIRPQIEWMNSAWWQWGAWTDAPLRRWINTNRPKSNWHAIANKWEALPWLKTLNLRLLPGNIIEDFNRQMNILVSLPISEFKINTGLAEPILRLFQHYRHLRPGPHDSEIEFILAKHLPAVASDTPWVIPKPLVEELLKYYLDDNKKLLEKLSQDQKEIMLNNSHWWSTDPYKLLTVKPIELANLNRLEFHSLAASAIEEIIRLNKKLKN